MKTEAQRVRDQQYPHSLHAGLCWVWTDRAGAERVQQAGLAHSACGQTAVKIDPDSGAYVVTVAEGDFTEARRIADGRTDQ